MKKMMKPTAFEKNVLDWFEVRDYIDNKMGKDFVDKSDIWEAMIGLGLTNDSYFTMARNIGDGRNCKEAAKIIFEEFDEFVEKDPEYPEYDELLFWVCW